MRLYFSRVDLSSVLNGPLTTIGLKRMLEGNSSCTLELVFLFVAGFSYRAAGLVCQLPMTMLLDVHLDLYNSGENCEAARYSEK